MAGDAVAAILAHPGAKRCRTIAVVRTLGWALLALVLLVTPALAQEEPSDPLEPLNRGIFQFNMVLDGLLLEPAARLYRMATPQFVRTGVSNFLANLRTPVVLANDLLQGEFERAELTLGRFMLNTILGVGGVVDVGGKVGMPERHYEDFGQTLAVYGVGSGPFLMLPLLGPSNGRDVVGRVADLALDPFSVMSIGDVGLASTEFSVARRSAETVSFREETLEEFDELKRSSIDLYAAVRTLYGQFRANEIRNGGVAEIDDIYDEGLYDDPEALDEDPADIYEDPEAGNAD
jgi:phospholipid-binding lipoprotein MlaA